MQLYYDLFVETICNEYVTFEFCGYVKKIHNDSSKSTWTTLICNLNGDQSDLNCRREMYLWWLVTMCQLAAHRTLYKVSVVVK